MDAELQQLRDTLAWAIEQERWDTALDACRTLEQLEPEEATWPHRAGDLCRRVGRIADAIVAYRRAVDRLSAAGDLVKAIALGKLVLELDPAQGDVQQQLAVTHG